MIRSILAVLVSSSFLASTFLASSFLLFASAYAADEKTGIPQLETAGVGWSKISDDFQPPASGPGPVTYDKNHPYVPNNNRGTQVTFRIADLTNPILKPWAIEKMREQNELAAAAKRAYEARASCQPEGSLDFSSWAASTRFSSCKGRMRFSWPPTAISLPGAAAVRAHHRAFPVRLPAE